MSRESSSFQIVACAGIVSAVLVAAFGLPVANSQGVAARATVAPKPPAMDELKALKKQVDSLTERVTELEKPQIDPSKDDDEGAARFAKLEKEIAALRAEIKEAKSADTDSESRGVESVVKAPFTVLNRAGKPILTVFEDGKMQGLTVHDRAGGLADTIGTMSEGLNGRIVVHGKAGASLVRLTGGEGNAGTVVVSNLGKNSIAIGSTPVGGSLLVYDSEERIRSQISAPLGYKAFNSGGQILAELGSVPSGGNGHLWIGNAAGVALVEAGMLTTGEGIVKAGPSNGAPPSALRLPDRIVGHLR